MLVMVRLCDHIAIPGKPILWTSGGSVTDNLRAAARKFPLPRLGDPPPGGFLTGTVHLEDFPFAITLDKTSQGLAVLRTLGPHPPPSFDPPLNPTKIQSAKDMLWLRYFCGPAGDRTPDLLIANEAFYH